MKTIRLTLLPILLLFCYSVSSQTSDLRSFVFGHSLIVHDPPLIPTPSNETTVPHWMYLLAQEAGHTYAIDGQYGFLPQHDNLPPVAGWGFDIVPGIWDSDLFPFSDADFNNILITAGNFIQYQPPYLPYYGSSDTPLSATSTIIDWLVQQENGLDIFIYENWPDMAGFLSAGFPPTEAEFASYNAETVGNFHNWWIEYHDSLVLAHPQDEIKMIPVGPIISELLTTTALSQIPITDLYEDDAPHGRPTIYFLAAMVTYMASYGEPTPASYVVPDIVHSLVKDNYATVVNFIWSELLSFNFPNGNSRVFSNGSLPVELSQFDAQLKDDQVRISWETQSEWDNDKFVVEHSRDGVQFNSIGERVGQNSIAAQQYELWHQDLAFGKNFYRLLQIDRDGAKHYSAVVVVDWQGSQEKLVALFPNPSVDGRFQLQINSPSLELTLHLYDSQGRLISQQSIGSKETDATTLVDLGNFAKGIYFLSVRQAGQQEWHKMIWQ